MDCVIFLALTALAGLWHGTGDDISAFLFFPGVWKHTRRLGVGTTHTPLFRLDQEQEVEGDTEEPVTNAASLLAQRHFGSDLSLPYIDTTLTRSAA